ncbi:MAG: aminotransferase class V-fold PLP-dependent enzyme [Nitratireductor sp.]
MSSHTSIVDPDGLLEFSVVFTDRSLNSMSKKFQGVMNNISSTMKDVYGAKGVAIVPGGGTYGMEAVARQFATDKNCMVIRNGWFSYRWTQIFDAGNIPASSNVLIAEQSQENTQPTFSPLPIEKVVAEILATKPDMVFAPHVETSAGIMLPDDYVSAIGEAVRSYGGLFALDCIASGTVWVDMKKCNVDILISAPQKGWSASPAAGLVMLGERAIEKMADTQSTSFACDLKKWFEIMQAYENGGHAYHATMPTDALAGFNEVVKETKAYGFEKVKQDQLELGRQVRALLKSKGYKSVAPAGFEAPGVVVSYTDDGDIKSGKKFAENGVQIAAGVPLQCNEPSDFSTFRIGLFGLDKLQNIERTVKTLENALEKVS